MVDLGGASGGCERRLESGYLKVVLQDFLVHLPWEVIGEEAEMVPELLSCATRITELQLLRWRGWREGSLWKGETVLCRDVHGTSRWRC